MIRPIATTLLLAALLVVSTWWVWRRVTAPPPPLPTPTALPPTLTPTATPMQAPAGYRLAGIALGDADAFAVIEGPNGRTGLYRLDADIPGLGRLVRIMADRAVLETTDGRFELQLGPASTPTPGAPWSAATGALTPKPPSPAAGRGPESSTSDDRDQPAF